MPTPPPLLTPGLALCKSETSDPNSKSWTLSSSVRPSLSHVSVIAMKERSRSSNASIAESIFCSRALALVLAKLIICSFFLWLYSISKILELIEEVPWFPCVSEYCSSSCLSGLSYCSMLLPHPMFLVWVLLDDWISLALAPVARLAEF